MSASLTTIPAELRLMIFQYLFLTLEPIFLLPSFFLLGPNKSARVFFEGFNLLFTTKVVCREVHQFLRRHVRAAIVTNPGIYPNIQALLFNPPTRTLQTNTIGQVGVWPSRVKHLRLDVPVMQNAFVFQMLAYKFISLEIIATDINIQCDTRNFNSDILEQFTNENLAKNRRKSPEWKPIFEGLKPLLIVTGALIASHKDLSVLVLDNQNVLNNNAVDFDFLIQRHPGRSHKRWEGDVRVSLNFVVCCQSKLMGMKAAVDIRLLLNRINVREQHIAKQKQRNKAWKQMKKETKNKTRAAARAVLAAASTNDHQ